MNETSATYVSASTTSRVVRIDTAAISSGTNASSDANTNASTASAPRPPISVSTSTPGPLLEPPLASWLRPVNCTCVPLGNAAATALCTCTGSFGAPKLFSRAVNSKANVERPSLVTNRRSWVTPRSTIRACGSAIRAWPNAWAIWLCSPLTVLPGETVTTSTEDGLSPPLPYTRAICLAVS